MLGAVSFSELQAGRFVELECPDREGVLRQRCYSIVAVVKPGVFEILVRDTGKRGVSDYLANKAVPGEQFKCFGVGGNVTINNLRESKHIVMLASGIGVTLPLALIFGFQFLAQPPKVVLVLSVRSLASVPYLARLLQLHMALDWFTLRIHLTKSEALKQNDCFKAGRPGVGDLKTLGVPSAVVICGGHSFSLAQQAIAQSLYEGAALFIEAFSGEAIAPPPSDGAVITQLSLPRLGLTMDISRERSLLDELERNGMAIRSQCRSGICGSCKVKVNEGEVRRGAEFALSASERQQGYALACCTYASGDVLSIDID